MPTTLIIAAGGHGTRFRSDFSGRNSEANERGANKLLFPFLGKPLLCSTLSRFQGIPQIQETIVAISREGEKCLRAWCKEYGWKSVKWVRGGATRAESVWNALKKANRKSQWIMVHDGARPLITQEAVRRLMASMRKVQCAGVILGRKVVPTIKRVDPSDGQILQTVDRRDLFEAETPQLLNRRMLEQAYVENKNAFNATDEAWLLESVGAQVKVLTHDAWNPKITTYQDMILAEAYLEKQGRVEVRTGFGRDSHRLVAKRKLYLGGVHIPFPKGALGHSDGDALLHAIADAVLGAIGGGDIGDHFSDRNPKIKGMRSEKILRKILCDALGKNWQPMHVDSVIVLEQPKLGARKQQIQEKIADMMGLDADRVSVKAKTAEGLGPEGEGLSISCEALVTMKKVAL